MLPGQELPGPGDEAAKANSAGTTDLVLCFCSSYYWTYISCLPRPMAGIFSLDLAAIEGRAGGVRMSEVG